MPQDKLTAVRIKQENGEYGPQIPVAAKAENVEYNEEYSVKEVLGDINVNKGPLQEQIENIDTSTIQAALEARLDEWEEQAQIPVTSVAVDSYLINQGQAADAKQAGKVVTINNEANGNATKLHLNTSNDIVNIALMDDLNTRINRPIKNGQYDNGEQGQLLRTNGDGSTEWVDEGLPKDEQVQVVVDAWMDQHSGQYVVPDESLTYKKLVKGTLGYVTPEMFGAIGDGITDDTTALRNMFSVGLPCYLSQVYLYTNYLYAKSNVFGYGTLKHGRDEIRLNVIEDNVTIKGINFDVNYHTPAAIRVYNENKILNNIHIENCNIVNVGNDNVTREVGGIVGTNVNNFWIKGCTIKCVHAGSQNSSYGISVNFSTNVFIENNYIEDISPSGDADGVKFIGGKFYAYVTNNIFKNCKKRCIKMKGEEIYSISNTFIYEDLVSFGQAVIEFQRSNCESLNDKLIIIITDSTLVTQFINVFGVNGNNIKIDGFTSEYIIPENYSLGATSSSCFVRIYKNDDVDASNTADNLILSNIRTNGISLFLIDITSNTPLTSVNNIQLKNIEFERNRTNTTYRVIGMTNEKMQIVDSIIIDGFTFTGPISNTYTLFGQYEYTYTKISAKNLINIFPFRYYTTGNIYAETDFSLPFSSSFIEGYKQTGTKLKLLYNGTQNPTASTAGSYQAARNTPIGTELLFISPIYNSGENKMQIGFICTIAGTTSAVGTFIPLYANI